MMTARTASYSARRPYVVRRTLPHGPVLGLAAALAAEAPLPRSAEERLYALYVLALRLDLRRGELLRLRWQDLDVEAGTLEVVQTLQRIGGVLRFVRSKTDDSKRTLPLSNLCIEALREHRERQAVERSGAWPNWTEPAEHREGDRR
jgi:integrase